jgi:hypothetical protein
MKCLAEDKNFVFNLISFTYGGGTTIPRDGILEIVNVHDAQGFLDLGSRYYLTETGIYFSEKQLSDADKDSFEVIAVTYNRHCYRYAKDKKSVYYNSKILHGADPRTFQIIGTSPYYSFDSKHRYSQGNDISELSESLAKNENIKFEEAYRKWQAGESIEDEQTKSISSAERRFKKRKFPPLTLI